MQLVVTERTVTKKHTKNLRSAGIIPGIVYGRHVEKPYMVQCNKNAFLKIYHQVGKSKPFNLVDEDGHVKEMVLIHDIQLDPVKDCILHVDFLALKKDEKVRTEVELKFVGESPVEKNKLGRLQKIKDVVEIEALPKDLPKYLEVDLSKIQTMQDVLFVKDIVLPKGVVVLDDPELPIVTVSSFEEEEEQTSEAQTSSPTATSSSQGEEKGGATKDEKK